MGSFDSCVKHRQYHPECLMCEIEELYDMVHKQQVIIDSFLKVYEAQNMQSFYFATQGQGMDGISALYNFNMICRSISHTEHDESGIE